MAWLGAVNKPVIAGSVAQQSPPPGPVEWVVLIAFIVLTVIIYR